jgi:intein-encoded DNA endonuclease-like protein
MSVVGVDIISKRGERRKYLPLEIRMKMYNDVIELGKQGLTCKEIQKRIYEKYGRQLPIYTIYDWVNGKHNPLGRVNKFDGKPSPKLEYVIGAIFTDGCKYFDSRNYRIELIVKDKEFAEEFGRCLAEVLGRKKPYKPFWSKSRKRWRVVGYSIQLHNFLKKSLEELKPHIEYSKETVASFLRAIFDAEGSIYI